MDTIPRRPKTHVIRSVLHQAGIIPSEVERRHNPDKWGYGYKASFFGDSVQTATTYVEKFEQHVEGLRVVSSHENRAEWREGSPVISATVYFNVERVPVLKTRALMLAPERRLIVVTPPKLEPKR